MIPNVFTVSCNSIPMRFVGFHILNNTREGFNTAPDTPSKIQLSPPRKRKRGRAYGLFCLTPICTLFLSQVGDRNLQCAGSLSPSQQVPSCWFSWKISAQATCDVPDNRDISGFLKIESFGSSRPRLPPGSNQGSWVAAAPFCLVCACQDAIWPIHVLRSPA